VRLVRLSGLRAGLSSLLRRRACLPTYSRPGGASCGTSFKRSVRSALRSETSYWSAAGCQIERGQLESACGEPLADLDLASALSLLNPQLSSFHILDTMLSTASTIDAAIKEATADPYTGLPRAVVVAATSDGEVYRGHGGWAQLPQDPTKLDAEGVPLEVDSVFELFSMTKLTGALAALQCVERGLFSLDDDASKFVPELKTAKVFVGFDDDGNPKLEDNSTPITIRMLATHTAGAPSPSASCFASPELVLTIPGCIQASRTTSGIRPSPRSPRSLASRRCPT